MSKTELTLNASHLLELSVDEVTEGGEGDLICKVIAKRRNKAIERKAKIPRYLTREWASWDGCAFTHIFTDGSYKEDATWEEQLLGTDESQAGGAVILSDGVSWYYKIYVKIDIEVEDAGQIELICLLIANEMARALGKPVQLTSDCKSALDIVNGAYSESFLNSFAGWKIWEGTSTKHIKAHPERHKKWGTWDGGDMGIYVADRVAGGHFEPHRTVSAKQWLIRISSQSKVAIELEDGTPFMGSVARRASRLSMKQYFMERDGYSENDPEFVERWNGANMARTNKLMARNGGFEDRVQARGGMSADTTRTSVCSVRRSSQTKDMQ